MDSLFSFFPSWETFSSFISHIVDSINPFEGVNFADLYSWLPSDIGAVCATLITLCVTFFIIGLVKKVLFFL